MAFEALTLGRQACNAGATREWSSTARHAIIEHMTLPAYPAARLVAPNVHAYFARQHAEARRDADEATKAPRGVVPDGLTIEAMINAAFWASLRREEGYVPKISLAYVSPRDAGQPITFARPLPLDPAALSRVAPAVERSGIHLGVWPTDPGASGGELRVWGTTQRIPSLCFVLEVASPGLLVIKHHRGDESGKYVNVAVLEGDQVKLVDERASIQPDCPALLTSLLGFDGQASEVDSANVLVELAVSMRAHGRGGSLLVVPASSETWRESVAQPIPYAVVPAYDELAAITRTRAANGGDGAGDGDGRGGADAFVEVVAAIAGLTAVDGATVLSSRYELLAFGATIVRRKAWAQVEQVMVTEPIEGGAASLVHPDQIGGTRHRSAAQFAHDQQDAMALVASHDGRFTVFAWSPHESLVRAHRIEALLL